MRQFIQGTDEAYGQLEQRASRACIRFRDQEMPPGTSPARADVGFEVDPSSGVARLLVSAGRTYMGADSSVAEWLRQGRKEFHSFDELRHWIRGELGQSFGLLPTQPEPSLPAADVDAALTNVGEIRERLAVLHTAVYIDEQELLARLRRRVLGQNHALESLAATMVRHCARRSPARPAVLFSVGPSGVGKTRTAEVLADALSEAAEESQGFQFLRLDMTEYQEAHRVSQLIGAPQGYVGHGEGSQLVNALRANPRTIVLFDEIEKAHGSILRVLMNAMDAGRLSSASDGQGGREIDCRKSVFIFTSNLDAKGILDELESRGGFGDRPIEDEVCRRRLHSSGIAPEIVGRIGRFLVYRPLNPETRAEIMALGIADVALEYGLKVEYIEPSVLLELMQKSRSDSFGVRPERFLIDDSLGGAFARVAQGGGERRIHVLGPPYRCVPQGLEATTTEGLDDEPSLAQEA